MSRVNEFTPCPLCGKTDEMRLTSEELYQHIRRKCGGFSCVMIECWRCSLSLAEHNTRKSTNNYHILVGELKKKWAKLKR